jgi:1,4-alpha-glucan branching enzyme
MNYKLLPITVLILALFIGMQGAIAQLITTDPAFPLAESPVTITFDATQGNQGLMNHTGDVYAHTGVITNRSANDTDWKFTKSGWRAANAPRLTRVPGEANKYTLAITPSIRAFYGVPAGETIQKIAFVFHDGPGGSKEAKTATGGDIYVEVYEPVFAVQLVNPQSRGFLVDAGAPIAIEMNASMNANFRLYVNDVEVQAARATGTTFAYTYTAAASGRERIRVVATNAANAANSEEEVFYYTVREATQTQAQPANTRDGINYIDDNTVVLVLHAPLKETVHVIGDFNDWEIDPAYQMKKDGERFWVQISDLEAGKEYIYQYLIDGSLRVGDPYAEKTSDPWHDQHIPATIYPNMLPYPTGKTTGIATVLQTGQAPYQWQVTDFRKPAKEKLVIYELLIRDFAAKHDYATLIDSLSYFQRLGINCIELLPIMEFEGNLSWGYNPSYFFAPDKYYGPKNDLKRFIDEAHRRGIAVVLDIVLNHAFGQSPMVQMYWDAANNRPAANSPWFNQAATHPFNVGFDFNHESAATQYFVDRVNEHWIREYNIDGYRFDLSKGFTQRQSCDVNGENCNVGNWSARDDSRIALLTRMANKIWEVDADSYVILEHFADNSEETILANRGMMLWGNLNHNYTEASMGWVTGNGSDLNWGSYKARGWNNPHLITYAESHDEERVVVKNKMFGNSTNPDHNVRREEVAIERAKLVPAFLFTIPGPKMIWQFGEMGYDYSINYCSNGTISEDCRTGNKPIRWDYLDQANRYRLFRVYSEMIKLKTTYQIFDTENYTLDVGGALKRIHLNSDTLNVTVIGNFDVVARDINPNFQQAGEWFDYFSGESITVSTTTAPLNLQPGDFKIYTTRRLSTPADGPILTSLVPARATGARVSSYPNPFTQEINISYELPATTQVTVKVYDMLGKEVKVLTQGAQAPGLHTLTWDGTNTTGNTVSRGTYFYRLQTGTEIITQKVLFTK